MRGATGIKIISDEAEANLRSAMTAFGAQQGSRNLLSGAATNQSTFAGADVLLDDIRDIMQTAGNGYSRYHANSWQCRSN